MRQHTRLACLAAAVAAMVAPAGCGGGAKEGAAAGSGGGSSSPASAGGRAGIQVCQLLTAQQVSTVLPNHDGGEVAHAGGSLIPGVDAYQCSYANAVPNIFTVVLNVAADDERFGKIKPSRSAHDDDQKVEAGDAGWVYGADDDLKVEVLKGRTVIDLELMAPGARGKSDAVVTLARAVAEKIH